MILGRNPPGSHLGRPGLAAGQPLGAVGAILGGGGPGSRLASQGGLELACSQLPFRAAFADPTHSKIVFFSDLHGFSSVQSLSHVQLFL